MNPTEEWLKIIYEMEIQFNKNITAVIIYVETLI